MKFTKIRFNGLTAIDLPMVNALPSDVYILKGVDGLGPPEVDVSIADTLNAGGYYQGRRPQARQIVAKVGLNPDHSAGQTASDLRDGLYGLLTPGADDNLTVQIMDATVLVQTVGYVSSMPINPFSKDPEVQVVVDCLGWYLEAPNLLFVAPVSKAAPAIDNVGSAPSGIHLEVIFTSNLSSWTLTNAAGKKMLVTYAFLSGDKLAIDTRPGSRGIWLTRGGVTTNIIYALSADSKWLMLHGGNNVFATSSAAFNWGDVYFLPQHWGI